MRTVSGADELCFCSGSFCAPRLRVADSQSPGEFNVFATWRTAHRSCTCPTSQDGLHFARPSCNGLILRSDRGSITNGASPSRNETVRSSDVILGNPASCIFHCNGFTDFSALRSSLSRRVRLSASICLTPSAIAFAIRALEGRRDTVTPVLRLCLSNCDARKPASSQSVKGIS